MPRASVCGCDSASPIVCTGPTGTPAASNAAIHSSSVRDDIEGDNDVDGMTKKLGASLKPIPVDETLLDYLEQNKRLQFIKDWRAATGK